MRWCLQQKVAVIDALVLPKNDWEALKREAQPSIRKKKS